MNKRAVFCLIIACVLAVFTLASAETTAKNFNLSFPMGESILDAKIMDERTMIVLTSTALYRIDILSGTQEKLGTYLVGSTRIYCDPRSGIYTTAKLDDSPFDTLYCFNEESSDWEMFAQIPMEMGNEFYGNVIDGCFLGDTFYFLEYMDGQSSVLASFGMTDQQTVVHGVFSINEGGGGIFRMGNQLACLDCDYEQGMDYYLFQFDPERDQVEKQAAEIVVPGIPQKIAYDADSDLYWVLSLENQSNTRVRVLYSGPSLHDLHLVASPVAGRRLLAGNNDCILLESERMMSYRCIADATEKLTLANFHTEYDSSYTVQHGVMIASIETDISRMLTMQDGSFDLFALSTTQVPNLKTIKEKKFFVDLSQNEVLKSRSEVLYSGISKVLWTEDGRLAAWVLDAQPYMFYADEQFLAQYGFSTPKTIGELLDQMKTLIAEGAFEDGEHVPFGEMPYQREDLVNYTIRRYIFEQEIQGRKLNFDDPALKEILERILREVPEVNPYPAMTGDESFVYSAHFVQLPISKDAKMPLKISADSPVAIETYTRVVVINPYSEHQDAALEYLSYLAQLDGEKSYTIYRDCAEPMKNAQIQARLEQVDQKISDMKAQENAIDLTDAIQTLEDERKTLLQSQYLIDMEDIAAWQRDGMAMLVQDESSFTSQLTNAAHRLAVGNMTVDAFINECNRYISMVYAENE